MTTITLTKKQGGVLKALASTRSKKGMGVGAILDTKLVKGAPSNPAASLYPILRNLVERGLVEEELTLKGAGTRGNRYVYRITPEGRKAAKAA